MRMRSFTIRYCLALVRTTESGKTKWPQLYLGVAFTTLATLILELSLTRIFSVVFYYHFAFLAISIALFGLGAGGLFSYVVAEPRRKHLLQTGRSGGGEQPGRGGVAGLHSDARRRTR